MDEILPSSSQGSGPGIPLDIHFGKMAVMFDRPRRLFSMSELDSSELEGASVWDHGGDVKRPQQLQKHPQKPK